jgi:hypothetical protein
MSSPFRATYPTGGIPETGVGITNCVSKLTLRCSSCSSLACSLPRSWNSPRGILLQTLKEDVHPTSNGDGLLFLTRRHNGITNILDRKHRKQEPSNHRQRIRQRWSIAHRNPLLYETN